MKWETQLSKIPEHPFVDLLHTQFNIQMAKFVVFTDLKSIVFRFNQLDYQNNFERGWHQFAVLKKIFAKLFSASEHFSINDLTSKTIWSSSRSFQQLHFDVKRKERWRTQHLSQCSWILLRSSLNALISLQLGWKLLKTVVNLCRGSKGISV